MNLYKNYYGDAPVPWYKKAAIGLMEFLLAIDWPLLVIVSLLTAVGFVALYSAGYSFPWRIEGQIRNIAVAAAAMLVVGLVCAYLRHRDLTAAGNFAVWRHH